MIKTIKEVRMKEKFLKMHHYNEQNTRKETTLQKSHQKSCPSGKMLGTILKGDERRTSTNRPENKKTHDDTYGLISHR